MYTAAEEYSRGGVHCSGHDGFVHGGHKVPLQTACVQLVRLKRTSMREAGTRGAVGAYV